MVTPLDIQQIIEATFGDVDARRKFMSELAAAENKAITDFRRDLKANGTAPHKLRIKVDLHWPEPLIKEAVNEYLQRGWTTVKYNRDDNGFREPQGYWVITIKM